MPNDSNSSSSSPGRDTIVVSMLGPCPFPKDHPQYANWLRLGRLGAELQARMNARRLERAASASSSEEMLRLLIEDAVECFDLLVEAALVSVENYEDVEPYKQMLVEGSKRVIASSRLERTPTSTLRVRLVQRVEHWTAEALKRARQAEEETQETSDNLGSKQGTDLAWQDVRLRFTSEFQVQVTIRDRVEPPKGYEEMGFADRRTKKPNFAWQALLELARQDGKLESRPRSCGWAKDWAGVEKRMEEARKTLRERFQIGADPLPLVKKDETNAAGGYEAVFRIEPPSPLDVDL